MESASIDEGICSRSSQDREQANFEALILFSKL
jgi:hypothetical protein